jgi:hypothetical protein
MDRIFFQIFSQVGPTTSNPNHDALTTFADKTDKQFDGHVFSGLM